MAGHLEDLWTRPTGRVNGQGRAVRERTERYGVGKRWLVSWQDAGRRRSRTFTTQDAAKTHLADVITQQQAGTYVSPHQLTVAEYGERWLAAQLHLRPSSADVIKIRWGRVQAALGSRKLLDVTRAQVQLVVIDWSARYAPSTVKHTYGALKRIMEAARDDRLIYENPCKAINLPQVPDERVVPLTLAQVQAIAGAIHPHYQGLVWLAAATGLRAGELSGLTVDRLSWFDSASPVPPQVIVRVDRQLAAVASVRGVPRFGPVKTPRSDRSVQVDGQSAHQLRLHMARFPAHSSGLIFTSARGTPLLRQYLSSAWTTACDKAGVDSERWPGWHQLRHFHASMLIAAGLSVTAVADRLGHKDVAETLRTYAHLWPTDEQRSVMAVAAGLWP